ncbi:MAG: hypothetical protein KDC83_04320 [Flavobacteriales bacterium]|nr:hypothetical protein [Flavobacteriales bacterium]
MDTQKAATIITALANGIDPITGEILPKNSPYNNPEVIRALFFASGVISNKSTVKNSPERQGAKWTEDEEDIVVGLFKTEASIGEIAKTQKRSYGAIRSKLEKLGLIDRN